MPGGIRMPIYEYQCKKCGAVMEHIQKFSDPPMTDCGDCGTEGSLEKMMSLSAFHLKGSGWYLTDYARKNTGPSSPDNAASKGSENTITAKASNSESSSGSDSSK